MINFVIARRLTRSCRCYPSDSMFLEVKSISGVQKDLTDLLLSFHPFYLQLALETVFGTKIILGGFANSSQGSVVKFLTSNLYTDQKILKNAMYAQGRTKYVI